MLVFIGNIKILMSPILLRNKLLYPVFVQSVHRVRRRRIDHRFEFRIDLRDAEFYLYSVFFFLSRTQRHNYMRFQCLQCIHILLRGLLNRRHDRLMQNILLYRRGIVAILFSVVQAVARRFSFCLSPSKCIGGTASCIPRIEGVPSARISRNIFRVRSSYPPVLSSFFPNASISLPVPSQTLPRLQWRDDCFRHSIFSAPRC